jgi:hypothetical protein
VAEQEQWGSIAQLAAEYETIAAAAQHDRWATLVRGSGLTDEQAESAIESEAFGPLAAELRRAEANHHNVDALLPRLVAARGFGDADDIAAVLHYRVERATARPAGSGRTRKPARLIAGLIPRAHGVLDAEMRAALDEREALIEARADAVLEAALTENAPWTKALGAHPTDRRRAAAWRKSARVVAAYRDRYRITDDTPLGAPPESAAQKIDAARARSALDKVRQLGANESGQRRPVFNPSGATSPGLGAASDPSQRPRLGRSLEGEADFSLPLGRSRQTFGSLSTHRLDNDSRVERSPS